MLDSPANGRPWPPAWGARRTRTHRSTQLRNASGSFTLRENSLAPLPLQLLNGLPKIPARLSFIDEAPEELLRLAVSCGSSRQLARAGRSRAGGPRGGSRRGRRPPSGEAHLVRGERASSRPRSAGRGRRASTSPTSSGSSADVTSSRSIARGRAANARAIATRCCWPPERLSGRSCSRPSRPKRARSFNACSSASARLDAAGADAAEDHVLHHVEVREEVVGLEDDAELAPDADGVDGGVGDHLAVEEDVAVVDVLEEVDAAKERRLARARRADQRHRLVLGDLEIDALRAPRARRTTWSRRGSR